MIPVRAAAERNIRSAAWGGKRAERSDHLLDKRFMKKKDFKGIKIGNLHAV